LRAPDKPKAAGDCHSAGGDLIRYPGAVVILPVLADGSIVLIRNYRFAVDQTLYELPAGCLEKGEPPERCAARELAEETGYTAGGLEKLSAFYTGPGTCDEMMHAFLATDLTDGEQNLERYEQITVEVHPESQVRDGKTLAALALYWVRAGA